MSVGPTAANGDPRRPDPSVRRIVGIGASAGGLESLEQFFANLPAEPRMAFVVVQHLSPDFRSMMSELLSRHSSMPVLVVEDGVPVQPNHVYLLPPKKEMTIEGGHLRLADKDPGHVMTMPIDLFFRSLAEDAGARGVAVVLSGSGTDGSRGIREVKRVGGLVLVESVESAKFDGMPLAAQATGLVDYSSTPRNLARFLLDGVRPDEEQSADVGPDAEKPLDATLRLLRNHFGLDFTLYKRSTVIRRILRRVEMQQTQDLGCYVERLRADSEELGALYHDLLIGVTQFFRDPEAFAVLERDVVPRILDRVPESEEIRVWVTGCATGEEAYSLAILFFEQLSARDRTIHFKLLATDVHRASLQHAAAGWYAEQQLEHVSPERRERFFSRRSGGFRVSQDLRQHIVFAPHNVTEDAPFTKMHLVSCRNFLIYLEPDAQRTVLALLHFGLVPSGFLFLGSSEAPGPFSSEFDTVDEHWKIYAKRRDVRLLDPLALPVTRRTSNAAAELLSASSSAGGGSPLLAVYDQLLDEFMPPGLLVDEERNLVDSFGGAERYLRFGRRRPSTNVLEVLEADLRTVVGGALQRAFGAEGRVRYSGVPLPSDDGPPRRVTLQARVLVSRRAGGRHALITFEDEEPRTVPGPGAGASEVEDLPAPEFSGERMSMLESELAYTRETLQTAVEEQQTSNEELQAANEELVASNEELQSTNEELHSVNEELYTVNGEYQKKILELREVNADMQHLLEGADNGTLFLDDQLKIRRFTPRIASVFHLRQDDVGRPIGDFSHDLQRETLLEDISRTLADGTAVEEEVRDARGTTYFLRIHPYRQGTAGDVSADGRAEPEAPEGVVMTLIDISALERARASVEQLSAIVESSDDAILSKDLDGIITSWNHGAERLYGYTAEEMIGQRVHLLAPPAYRAQIDEFLATVERGERVEHVETIRARKDGEPLDVSVTISPIHDGEGKIIGASAIARDITGLKQVHRELERRESRIRLLLDSTEEAIFGLGPDGSCTFCNPACARMLGHESPEVLIGQRMHELVHHSRSDGTPYPEEECSILRVLRTGDGAHADAETLHRADGSTFLAEYWSHPITQDGELAGAVVTFLDVTARRQDEEEIRLAAERREHFLAMLSHELRNPLAAVLNATELMRARPAEHPVSPKALGVIERQSKHMARLLDDLLDVSRITRGGIELRREDLDLREPVRHAVEAVATTVDERAIVLHVDLPDRPVPVRGDATRLQQIVGNLLTNAAKYSPKGSRVSLSVRADGEQAVVSVDDEGDGIAPELLPHVFDLFVQNEQGLDRSKGGLGVGLALVRQLTELHGGRVEAASDGPGKGSEFRVLLPLQRAGRGRSRNGGAGGSRPKRVVLVEDQDDAREVLKELLEARGHVVFAARDGREAIEMIEREHPDAALVDIGLPVLDGFAVAKRLRASPVHDDVLLVALTGYGTRDDITAVREAGFAEHLTKPADPDRIDAILRGSSAASR